MVNVKVHRISHIYDFTKTVFHEKGKYIKLAQMIHLRKITCVFMKSTIMDYTLKQITLR